MSDKEDNKQTRQNEVEDQGVKFSLEEDYSEDPTVQDPSLKNVVKPQ